MKVVRYYVNGLIQLGHKEELRLNQSKNKILSTVLQFTMDLLPLFLIVRLNKLF